MFWILTSLIAALVIAATAFAFLRTGDAFHPLVYLGPMLLFIYCVMPWMAAADGRLYDYLPDSLLGLAQAIHLAGVASLVAGVLAGGGRARSPARRRVVLPLRVWRLALGAGLLGLGSFIYGITSVGGLSEAYGRAYGGGWAASGYVRDLTHFALPAAVYLIAPATGVSRKVRYVAVAMVVSPIAIHRLLGAPRGPRLETDHRAIAPYDLVLGQRRGLRTRSAFGERRGSKRLDRRGLTGKLHSFVSSFL